MFRLRLLRMFRQHLFSTSRLCLFWLRMFRLHLLSMSHLCLLRMFRLHLSWMFRLHLSWMFRLCLLQILRLCLGEPTFLHPQLLRWETLGQPTFLQYRSSQPLQNHPARSRTYRQ